MKRIDARPVPGQVLRTASRADARAAGVPRLERVLVHVDRLVLKGVAHADRRAVAAGLNEELKHLFANPEALGRLRAAGGLDGLNLGRVDVARDASPFAVGVAAARRIGRGLPE